MDSSRLLGTRKCIWFLKKCETNVRVVISSMLMIALNFCMQLMSIKWILQVSLCKERRLPLIYASLGKGDENGPLREVKVRGLILNINRAQRCVGPRITAKLPTAYFLQVSCLIIEMQ